MFSKDVMRLDNNKYAAKYHTNNNNEMNIYIQIVVSLGADSHCSYAFKSNMVTCCTDMRSKQKKSEGHNKTTAIATNTKETE